MPWPPRLLCPPLLPLLTVILLSFIWTPSPASAALSYGDGQPEYPSQPQLTSDRDALARIFLQDLLEKQGNSHSSNGYTNRDDDTWLSGGRSLRRSDGGDHRHFMSQQDVYPRDLGDGGDEDFLDEDDGLDPRTERERVISALLARGHPYTGHRVHGYVDPSHLAEDPEEQTLRLKELLREVMGEESPISSFRSHEARHGARAATKEGDNGSWGSPVVIKRNPFGINARGFHDDVFNRDFGSFNPMKRVARSVEGDAGVGERRNQTDDSSAEGVHKENASRRVKRSANQEGKEDSNPEANDKPNPPKDPKENISGKPPLKREERSTETTNAGITGTGQRVKRRPEMDSSGFHGDTFNSGFGDFWTMKRNSQYLHPYGLYKRRPEMDSSGFHGDTFNSGFGDFWTMKRNMAGYNPAGVDKRRPEMDSSGFHGDLFSSGFGDFYTMKRNPMPHQEEKRRPEMDSSGFHGDTFNGGFGDFWTMKRTALAHPYTAQAKRRPEMDSSGFHGDTFNGGFGDFWTMKRAALAHPLNYPGKRRPEMDSSGFHGDTFNGGFGDFWTMKRAQGDQRVSESGQNGAEGVFLDYKDRPLGKRRPEMDSSGFHGDTFNGGFGDFWTMKKRSVRARREVGGEKLNPSAMQDEGFDELLVDEDGSPSRWAYGRLESKRRPEMDSSGFHGDTFNSGFGDFWTMKRNQPLPYTAMYSKRRPEMDSSGFHGDTFNSGFGDFWTMKRGGGYGYPMPLHADKRKPEMDSSGFHGDTFHGGFGDFWTMKRSGYEDRMTGEKEAGKKLVNQQKVEVEEVIKDKGSEDDRGEGSGKTDGKNDDKKN